MANKVKKKIGSKQNKPKQNVKRGTEPIQSDSPLTFNFSKKHWMKSVNIKSFTNKLKGQDMFSEYIFELFHNLIPVIHEHGDIMIRSAGTGSWIHCHPIENEELDLALSIVESVHGHQFKDASDGSKLWQFGVSGGIRLIAIHNYKDNYLTPLFVDYHHQIYPSEKHNQKDINKYPFCPIDSYS